MTALRNLLTTTASAACFLVTPGLPAQDNAPPAEGPKPIKIVREREPIGIPEVPRDQVIGFALYTVQDGVLKLSAQLYPLKDGEDREVTLHADDGSGWKEVARAPVNPVGWQAMFRVDGWDHSKDHAYKVTHPAGAEYTGRIRKDPADNSRNVTLAPPPFKLSTLTLFRSSTARWAVCGLL